jgi:putative transposase
MIIPDHALPITRQSNTLGISRSSVYYLPKPVSQRDQALMRRIDRLHLSCPFAGARMLRDMLRLEGFKVGRKHVRTLMRKMGVEALYRRPRTTRKNPAHRIYPYLLRNRKVERSNEAWAMDITYIPMARGFVYLTVVLDWYSRRVLSHRVSITMDTEFCLEAVEEAIDRHGAPEIMNTDQGSQFTSQPFTQLLKDNDIQISMDGKGAWRDNVFVERLWRSIKYEEVYLHGYDSVQDAKSGLQRYLEFYNQRRPHSTLDGVPPDQVYFNPLPVILAA